MEIEYNGYRIVEADVDQDCRGFRMQRVFKVLDEFDDPLPINHTAFWSPTDAMQAIDFVQDVFKTLHRGQKWPTTRTYEMNLAMAYRANFVHVYQVLRQIKKTLDDCEEMGDDPTAQIRSALELLHLASVNPRPAKAA